MGWGQVCRLRHVTSGRYLAVSEDNQVATFHRSVATEEVTAFILRQSKVKLYRLLMLMYQVHEYV